MTINKGFLPIQSDQLTDHRLQSSLIAAYSIPRPTSDYFEKNIELIQNRFCDWDIEKWIKVKYKKIRNKNNSNNQNKYKDLFQNL